MGSGPVIDHQEDFLRAELRDAIDSRQPDRTAMLNRIAANRADHHRPRRQALRLAGSALAVTGVLGLGGVAQWALAGDTPLRPEPAAPPPAATATAAPAPSAPASLPPSAATTPSSRPPVSRAPSSGPPSASTAAAPPTPPAAPASPVRGHPGDTQVVKGSMSSTSSIVEAGHSQVVITAGADLTEFDLMIRVPLTPGLTPGAGTSDVPGVSVSVEKRADALIYRYLLGAGRTIPAGTYVFDARYGGGERNAAEDTYESYATSVERKRIHLYGNFLPKD
jgi:hypothetical protein